MSKNLFLVGLIAVLSVLNCISVKADARWGAKLGLPLSSIKFTHADPDKKSEIGSKAGFQIGVFGELGFGGNLNFQPEFFFTQGGGVLSVNKQKDDGETYKKEETYDFGELQIPLNIKYTYHLKKLSIFGLVGPYAGYTIIAKRTENSPVNNSFENLLKKNNEEGERWLENPLEIGVNIGVGVELKNDLFFEAGYKFGLTDIRTETELAAKKSAFSIGVGFYF
ncbi:MAG: PorT family protein [Dysgonamonadaceae bacterium]|nr:PorT family protein [Dysgonamonadaceae bacterium]